MKKEKLINLLNKGVGNLDCIGVHGTSLEATINICNTDSAFLRKIDIGRFEEIDQDRKAYLFFFEPIKEKLKRTSFYEKIPSWTGIKTNAEDYAKTYAFQHYLKRKIPIDSMPDLELMEPSDSLYPRCLKSFLESAKKYGFSEELALKQIEKAREREGVQFGVSRNILDEFEILFGNSNDELTIVYDKEEFPLLKYCTGIQFVREYEENVFRKYYNLSKKL